MNEKKLNYLEDLQRILKEKNIPITGLANTMSELNKSFKEFQWDIQDKIEALLKSDIESLVKDKGGDQFVMFNEIITSLWAKNIVKHREQLLRQDNIDEETIEKNLSLLHIRLCYQISAVSDEVEDWSDEMEDWFDDMEADKDGLMGSDLVD